MRRIKRIIIHCSATPEGINLAEKDIEKMHIERGFRTTGYHFVILLDGSIQVGRGLDNTDYIDENEIGAHALGLNKDTVGVCYIGGVDKDGKPKDTRTEPQKKSIKALSQGLSKQFGASINGHNEFSNKACPCFDVDELRS